LTPTYTFSNLTKSPSCPCSCGRTRQSWDGCPRTHAAPAVVPLWSETVDTEISTCSFANSQRSGQNRNTRRRTPDARCRRTSLVRHSVGSPDASRLSGWPWRRHFGSEGCPLVSSKCDRAIERHGRQLEVVERQLKGCHFQANLCNNQNKFCQLISI
jgi:hypothetical protein